MKDKQQNPAQEVFVQVLSKSPPSKKQQELQERLKQEQSFAERGFLRAETLYNESAEATTVNLADEEALKAHYRDALEEKLAADQAYEGFIAFLASDDASFVAGAHLVVDGGLTARTGQPIVPPTGEN